MTWKKADEVAAEVLSRVGQVPVCPKCGYPVKGDFCPTCATEAAAAAEQAEKDRQRDIKRLGGLKAYDAFTLHQYDNKPAISMCDGYPDINLYIWGPAGSGKTHLATAVARGYREAVIAKPSHLYRKTWGVKNGEEVQAIVDKIAGLPLLVIDDLGADKATEAGLSLLYEVIEARDMNYRKGLIVTSNLSLGALSEKIGDDRITSRLRGMCRVVEIKGRDRRAK
ncbi:MAG: ATP-binding protein [Sphaerochaeta sp.]|jgi:DNA replication protein DnaC|nr:ATP-binding protein [Sphaerochaeta sp.]